MQTFLPAAPTPVLQHDLTFGMIYFDSLKVLDNKRLGKQRVETLQLVNTLLWGGGWANHPAARMWRDHLPALIQYGLQCCYIWQGLGFNDTVAFKLESRIDYLRKLNSRPLDYTPPPWMGDPDFHRSHQSNLVRKLPVHYRQYWDSVPDDLPYIWPV